MAKHKLLEYTIHLRDQTLVNAINAQLQTLAGGPLVNERIRIAPGIPDGVADLFRVWRAPYNAGPPEGGASVEYADHAGAYPPALPMVEVGGAIPTGGAGYVTSPWFSSSNTLRRDVKVFTISSGWWIFGSSTKFYWGAKFEWAPPTEPSSGTVGPEVSEPTPIPTRIALVSGHTHDLDSGLVTITGGAQHTNLGSLGLDSSRAAARDADGFGLIYNDSTAAAQFHQAVHQGNRRGTWERFYIEIPSLPNVSTQVWKGENGSIAGRGFSIDITGTPQIGMTNWDSTASGSFIGSFGPTLELGRRYKVDTCFDIDATANLIVCDVYLDGVFLTSQSRSADGAVGVRFHSQSTLGKVNSLQNSTARFRFGGWVLAFPPKTRDRAVPIWDVGTPYVIGDHVHVGTSPATWKTYRCLQNNTGQSPGPGTPALWRLLTDPVDWKQGSLLQWLRPKAFGATHNVAWGGSPQLLGKPALSTGSVGTQMTTNVSGARCACVMNTETQVGPVPGAIGFVSAMIQMCGPRGASGSGTLGYKIGSEAVVQLAIAQSLGSNSVNSVMYAPVALTEPKPLSDAIEFIHEKSAFAENCSISILQGTVELIGVFDECDIPAGITPPPVVRERIIGRHNAQIPMSPWCRQLNSMGPVQIIGGTYVGNGTGQEIAFKVPPCFIVVRNTTTLGAGYLWWCTELDAHLNNDEGTFQHGCLTLRQDFSFAPGSPTDDQQMRWLLSVGGALGSVNQNAQTYQYIAFCDPGRRYALGGADHGAHVDSVPFTHALDISDWLPELAWVFKESISSTTTNRIFVKMLGMAANALKDATGATMDTNALTFAAGALTFRTQIIAPVIDQISYMGFRRQDGNNDPNEHKVMFMGSYVGDGVASRTISLSPVTGLRPMFAIVVPANADSIYRDPSHLTNTSCNLAAFSNITTGITSGGVDSFTVGSSLNSNGVEYFYWGFFSPTATAGNGGWGTNGENTPVITETVPIPDIEDEPIEVPVVTTTVVLANEPDLENTTNILDSTLNVGGTTGGSPCETYTRELVNIALQHIGISKVIGNLVTEQSEAAAQARRFIRKDVNAALRDFDWDFATAYQNLVLNTGSVTAPANNDWTYAYFTPNAMMKARRITKIEKGRKFDNAPIAFREGLILTRPVIFCNTLATAEVPLVLEYTTRVSCPAFYGDALFREALTWKFAASFAMTLARDKDKQQSCLAIYTALLKRSTTVDANEQQQEPPGEADWISGRN